MLTELYSAQVDAGHLNFDPQQVQILSTLDVLRNVIIEKKPTLFSYIKNIFQKPKLIQGVYLWGTVGSGKTHLMNLFFDNLPISKKLRLHFHHFMTIVHNELSQLQGKPDPLKIIAKNFALKTSVLCFDEFVVNDIVDAMLLGRLFKFLFERGVILIATSNRPPDDLYFNGLQRLLFLPAIALIKEHCQILNLSSTQDYRWRNLKQAGVYLSPLNEINAQQMMHFFNVYATGTITENTPLIIEQRPIITYRQSQNTLWLDFKTLCAPPRSQRDYLAIAQQFSIVLISNLIKIDANDEATVCYFIELIDIFYDNHILLILSSAISLQEIYPEGPHSWTFERTLSRLIEMQSVDYLQLCHQKYFP